MSIMLREGYGSGVNRSVRLSRKVSQECARCYASGHIHSISLIGCGRWSWTDWGSVEHLREATHPFFRGIKSISGAGMLLQRQGAVKGHSILDGFLTRCSGGRG